MYNGSSRNRDTIKYIYKFTWNSGGEQEVYAPEDVSSDSQRREILCAHIEVWRYRRDGVIREVLICHQVQGLVDDFRHRVLESHLRERDETRNSASLPVDIKWTR